MFKHYLASALRHFRQHTFTTGINVLCLALGLTCFLTAWGVTAYYSQADQYHERAARTFILTTKEVDSSFSMTTSPWLLAEHLRTDFPTLEAVARVLYQQEAALTSGGKNAFASVTYADAEFLKIFDLPFVHGANKTALEQPRTAIVSKQFAKRMFGAENVVGRTFRLSGRDDEVSITGVVAAIPQPSHISTTTLTTLKLSFDVMLSMDMNASAKAQHRWDNNWYFTYVVLPADGSMTIDSLNVQLKSFVERHIPESATTSVRYRARPISEFTAVNADILVGAENTGVSAMTILKLLGGLVLLVACLNYANLATAQAATRAKEVAMRRVVGANRAQLMAQHFMEGLLLTGAALCFSLIILALIAASLDGAVLTGLAALFAAMPQFWVMLFALLLTVSIVAAAYPALLLVRVRPAVALRGGKVKGGPRVIAALLVGLQFGSASFLLIAVMVMGAQNNALKQAVWNPASDPVIVLGNDLRTTGVDPKLLKQELLRVPGVHSVGAMHRMPWTMGGNAESLSTDAGPEAQRISSGFTVVDESVLDVLDLKLLAGRNFSIDRAEDVANMAAWQRNDFAAGSDYNIVIERSMVQRMGFASPQDALGKTLYHPTSQNGLTPPQRMHVIGVAEDAVIRPMNLGAPSFYLMNRNSAVVPVIRIAKQDVASALAGIDALWKKLAPEVPLKRRFADEQYELSHEFFSIINGVFTLLAAFAIVIASMGLIGMALHIIRRRTHEIGVRKTLGASVSQILWMLLRSFSKPVVIANLVAWPLAYVVMRGYLSLFSHQAGLTPLPFVLTFVGTVAIAWLAVAWQATRAARMNPATVLRYE